MAVFFLQKAFRGEKNHAEKRRTFQKVTRSLRNYYMPLMEDVGLDFSKSCRIALCAVFVVFQINFFVVIQVFDDSYKSQLSCVVVDDVEKLMGEFFFYI